MAKFGDDEATPRRDEKHGFESLSWPTGGMETILVAEDDRLIRELVHKVLVRAGYEVLLAADGEAAWEAFEPRANDVDLAILDMVMPKSGGKQVCERVRVTRPDLPVIFCSGISKQRIEAGIADIANAAIVRKPYKVSELLIAIRQLLDA